MNILHAATAPTQFAQILQPPSGAGPLHDAALGCGRPPPRGARPVRFPEPRLCAPCRFRSAFSFSGRFNVIRATGPRGSMRRSSDLTRGTAPVAVWRGFEVSACVCGGPRSPHSGGGGRARIPWTGSRTRRTGCCSHSAPRAPPEQPGGPAEESLPWPRRTGYPRPTSICGASAVRPGPRSDRGDRCIPTVVGSTDRGVAARRHGQSSPPRGPWQRSA